MNDSQLLIGLVAIAVTIFLGFIGIAFVTLFGLRGFRTDILKDFSGFRTDILKDFSGFRKDITSELSTFKETVIAVRTTVEKTWDLVLSRFPASGRTVERELENLGKVKITAEPGADKTSYLIEVERPVLISEYIAKIGKETELLHEGKRLFGQEPEVIVLSPTRMRWYLPSTDPKTCTEFVTFLLKWLNSTYVDSLKDIKEFEEPILT